MSTSYYKKQIAAILKCDELNVFLYWKGRIALYAILKSLHLNPGDEVIIPAFTCVVVPNAILYAGLKPVYVDIKQDTFNMNTSLIESAITSKTKVIICQNTFGMSSGIEEIIALSKKYNLFTIEDCTHGFGGMYKGKPNGSHCDAAFFSTQWNKPFSTGIGGFLVLNNLSVLKSLNELEEKKIKPEIFEKSILYILLIVRKFFLNKYSYWYFVKIYRFLSRINLILGSNQGDELNSTIMPKEYFKDISKVQINEGIKNLKKIESINEVRKKNAFIYTAFLRSQNKNYVCESLFENHMFLKYPLLVNDKKRFFELAIDAKITLGDWFLSVLHPIEGDLKPWFYNYNHFPVANYVAEHIVNLPTDIFDNKNVIAFLSTHIDLII